MHDMFLMCPHSIKYFYKEVMFEFCQRSSASNEMIMCFCLSACLYDRLFFLSIYACWINAVPPGWSQLYQDELFFFFSCILGLLKLWIILLNSFAIFFYVYMCKCVCVCMYVFSLFLSVYVCRKRHVFLPVCLSIIGTKYNNADNN